ncbi:MAG: LD-carboxypeptidase [Paludibacteraceae bacterium]|nr:LD-carboxypeptidase [Paludibacteraceae bacterium]
MEERVHIVVPAGRIEMRFLDMARQRLESWGFRVTEGEHARQPLGRFGGTKRGRAEDLNEAFRDPDIQYILCARGGYGMVQIVDQLAAPTNKAVPIGFSDITALHLMLGQYNVPCIHAAMAKHIAEYKKNYASVDALQALMTGEPLHYEIPPHPLNRPGKVEALLRGGNLSVLYGLQGTPYALRTDEPCILFLEDVGERAYAIDRMLNNLRLSGVLRKIKGLVVGNFSDYEEDPQMGGTLLERIRMMVEPYDYPVLFRFPAGHVTRNLPLVMNAMCRLEVTDKGATLSQDSVTNYIK